MLCCDGTLYCPWYPSYRTVGLSQSASAGTSRFRLVLGVFHRVRVCRAECFGVRTLPPPRARPPPHTPTHTPFTCVRSLLGRHYRCLEENKDDLSKALPLYSRRRAPEAKDLVELSRGFDRTGVSGFFGFVLPLIVDSICHKLAPAVFAPNTISFLQREEMTFRDIRLRKMVDRVSQGVLLAAAVGVVFGGARVAWTGLGPLMVRAISTVTRGRTL